MVEPATAEPEGYLAAQAKGHVRRLPGGAADRCEIEPGISLAPAEAAAMAARIERIVAGR